MEILKKMAKILGRFPIKFIFITIFIVGLLATGVINVYMATGNDTLVQTDTEVYQDNEMLENEFGGESVIVLYESDELLTPKHLQHMKGLEDMLQTNDSIYSMMSPVTLVEKIAIKQFETSQEGISQMTDGLEGMGTELVQIGDELKSNANSESDMGFPEMGGLDFPALEGPERAKVAEQQAKKEMEFKNFKSEMQKKQEAQTSMLKELGIGLTAMGDNLEEINQNIKKIDKYSDIMTPGLPDNQATLDNMLYDNGELRTMFEEVVVDDHHMVMMIKFTGDTNDDTKSNVIDTIRNYLDDEQLDSLKTIVSGKPVLDNGIRSSMQNSIQKMMGLALLLMIIVLFLVFKVRWFLLPLLTVLIAVIGTVGLMGWLQIPITMVSMAVFPILIGLGIDYAIQFQNRYTEEMAEEDLNE